MYRTLHFQYAHPTGWEFNERGDAIVPGGRALAAQIAKSLEPAVARISEVCQHELYGWSFRTEFCDCVFYHVLNPADPDVYLTVQMPRYLLKRLLRRRPRVVFERYCELIVAAVRSTAETRDTAWEPFRA